MLHGFFTGLLNTVASMGQFNQVLIVYPNCILQEAVREMFKRFVMRIKPGGYLVICDDR